MLADPRRFAASVAGVGLALMLILLLDGLSAGIDARVIVYEERSGAAFFVGQPGTTSFLGTTSSIPKATVDQVRALPDVDWAVGVRGFFTVPQVNGIRVPSYVVGSEPGARGGAWSIADGRVPSANNEIAVGQQFAKRGGVAVGDSVALFGKPFDVVGVAADSDMFMASFVFMTHKATDMLLNAPLTTSFVLVGTDQPERVREALVAAGLNGLSRDEIQRNDLALKGQAYSVGLGLVVSVAFLVGTLVIALTIYSSVMERRREYGIVKAIGATTRRLFRLVLVQSLVLAAIGHVAGGVFYAGGSALLGRLRPEFAIATTSTSLARVVGAAVVMGCLATFIPARRLAAMEPAAAFKGR
jgi:putative ABC transport system permease protein